LVIIRHQNSIFCVIQNCVSAIDTLAGYTWVVKLTANFFKALKAARFLAGKRSSTTPELKSGVYRDVYRNSVKRGGFLHVRNWAHPLHSNRRRIFSHHQNKQVTL